MQRIIQLSAVVLIITGMAAQAFAEPATESKMEKTVVTSTRTEVSIKDAPGAITIITSEDIKDIAASDILDIVRDTAGVSLTGRSVGGRSVISLRGLDSRQTLILIDGKRVPASDPVFGHSDYEQSWVPIEAIDRIEVVRGPLSALYGSEAMGGVINIITRKSTEKWLGSARIGGGVRDDNNGGENQTYAAYVSGPLVKEKLGLALSAEYLKDANTPDHDQPQYSEIEGKEAISASAVLTYAPTENHSFNLDVNLTTDDRTNFTSSRGRDYEALYDLDKVVYGLGWQGTIGPTRSRIQAYRSDIEKNSIRNYADDGERTDYPEQLVNEVIDAQTSFSIGPNLITLGGELRKEELESTTLTIGKDDIAHQALFIQDELSLFGNRLLLTPGVRWDDHEEFGSEVSPRVYVLYKVTDSINIKAGYGHAFRAPTIKQVSAGYEANNGPHTFLGNPDVEPEISDAYEAGIEYFGDKIFARAIYFYNDIENLIEWDRVGNTGPGGRFGIFEASNIAEAETKGVETEIGITLPKGFEITAAYTYLDAEDTENDVRLTEKPRHSFTGKLNYRSEALGLSTSLRAQHIGDQVLENDDDELEEVPDYTLWHFSIRKRFLQHFEVQVGVDNITDVRLADESELYQYEERGRFYYANLRYEF
jgi:outer membrane receptor for ferrienterochelin and colicins